MQLLCGHFWHLRMGSVCYRIRPVQFGFGQELIRCILRAGVGEQWVVHLLGLSEREWIWLTYELCSVGCTGEGRGGEHGLPYRGNVSELQKHLNKWNMYVIFLYRPKKYPIGVRQSFLKWALVFRGWTITAISKKYMQ